MPETDKARADQSVCKTCWDAEWVETGRQGEQPVPCPHCNRTSHTPDCDDEGCYCPDDAFWGRLLGDDDPCAPGKDWAAAAFGPVTEGGAR